MMKNIKCLFGVAGFSLRRFNALWRTLRHYCFGGEVKGVTPHWWILVVAAVVVVAVAGCETSRRAETSDKNIGVQSCKADADCTGDKLCIEGKCKTDAASGGECDYSSECPAEELCKDGACVGVEEWKDEDKADEDEEDGDGDKDSEADGEKDPVKGVAFSDSTKTITVTCGKDVDKSFSANCNGKACDWSVTPDLPLGLAQNVDDKKLKISGKVDAGVCVGKKDTGEVFTITACVGGTTDCASKEVTLKFKMDELKLEVQKEITVTKGYGFELALEATGGSGEYEFKSSWDNNDKEEWCADKFAEEKWDCFDRLITGDVFEPAGLVKNNDGTASFKATTKKTGIFYIPITVTDSKATDLAPLKKRIELVVNEPENGFSVQVEVDGEIKNQKELKDNKYVYAEIKVPYKGNLEIVPSEGWYCGGAGCFVKPYHHKWKSSEECSFNKKLYSPAGQEKVVVFEKIIFQPNPCNFKIVNTSPSEAEVFEKKLGDEIGATFEIEGGAEDAEYEWTVKRKATSISINNKTGTNQEDVNWYGNVCDKWEDYTCTKSHKPKPLVNPTKIECNDDDKTKCAPTGKFSYKFSKELSDKAKDQGFDIDETITVTATTGECTGAETQTVYKVHVPALSELDESTVKAKINIGVKHANEDSSFRIKLFQGDSKPWKELGHTIKQTLSPDSLNDAMASAPESMAVTGATYCGSTTIVAGPPVAAGSAAVCATIGYGIGLIVEAFGDRTWLTATYDILDNKDGETADYSEIELSNIARVELSLGDSCSLCWYDLEYKVGYIYIYNDYYYLPVAINAPAKTVDDAKQDHFEVGQKGNNWRLRCDLGDKNSAKDISVCK